MQKIFVTTTTIVYVILLIQIAIVIFKKILKSQLWRFRCGKTILIQSRNIGYRFDFWGLDSKD
jgi:hypothetical protein